MARPSSFAPRVGLVLALAGCGNEAGPNGTDAAGDAAGGDATDVGAAAGADAGVTGDVSTQVPPMGQKMIEPWLAAGHYRAWACEAAIFDARTDPATGLKGSHGRHRVCSNDILMGSTAGAYPLGASSVKEMYDVMDRPYGFAVGVKVADGFGDHTWYWYERVGRLATLSPVADGIGTKTCGGDCHAKATRDNVFVRAR